MNCFKWPVAGLGFAILAIGILAGCATPTTTPSASETSQSEQEQYRAQIAAMAERDPLYVLLTAELAQQRGDHYSATLAYTEAAKLQQDPELAKRAVEIALGEGLLDLGLEAAELWASIAPADKQAARSVLLLQLGTNRVEQAMPALKAYLAEVKAAEDQHPGISAATPERVALELLLRIPDKMLAYKTGIDLFGNNANDLDNQTLLAQIANSAEQFTQAVQHMDNVTRLAPDQERFFVLKAQMIEKRDGNPQAAMDLMQQKAAEQPSWFGALLYLARAHTQLEQWDQAKLRFAQMIALQPENIPLYSSLGFIHAKLGEAAEAERNFGIYLARTPAAERQNEVLIYATLSDIAADAGRYAKAHEWLDKAPNAKADLDIQLKKAALFERQGNLLGANRVLTQFSPVTEDDTVRLALAQSQLAEKREVPEQAVATLEKALKVFPDQPDLLYERAMVAERQKDLVTVEARLRRLIEVRPDNPHGYNALGYTWADNNMRLPEALELIAKANELAPEDPFILDSLGWVYFKLGDLERAESYLKQAYQIRPDEEIGVHLLEVLHQAGKKEEAQALRTTLESKYPNSKMLRGLRNRIADI